MQFGAKPLFENVSVKFGAGNRYGLIGANGCGKSTFMKILGGDLDPSGGQVMLEPNVRLGKLRQDQFAYEEFTVLDTVIMGHEELWKVKAERDRIYSLPEMTEDESNLFDWMGRWTKEGEQVVRGTLGRMLFSNDEILKSVKVISGGEQGRMLFGKLILQKPNVLIMDEPTNHLDMESIEALNLALENYPGTLIFVSHDREFVSSLATRIIELSPSGVIDFSGTYDDYLRSQGVVF